MSAFLVNCPCHAYSGAKYPLLLLGENNLLVLIQDKIILKVVQYEILRGPSHAGAYVGDVIWK